MLGLPETRRHILMQRELGRIGYHEAHIRMVTAAKEWRHIYSAVAGLLFSVAIVAGAYALLLVAWR